MTRSRIPAKIYRLIRIQVEPAKLWYVVYKVSQFPESLVFAKYLHPFSATVDKRFKLSSLTTPVILLVLVKIQADRNIPNLLSVRTADDAQEVSYTSIGGS